jgi:hypothetical protein
VKTDKREGKPQWHVDGGTNKLRHDRETEMEANRAGASIHRLISSLLTFTAMQFGFAPDSQAEDLFKVTLLEPEIRLPRASAMG